MNDIMKDDAIWDFISKRVGFDMSNNIRVLWISAEITHLADHAKIWEAIHNVKEVRKNCNDIPAILAQIPDNDILDELLTLVENNPFKF